MWDLTIRLEDRPGALAEMGETLGAAGVSVEAAVAGSSMATRSPIFCSKMARPRAKH